jgi:hypothetical protein
MTKLSVVMCLVFATTLPLSADQSAVRVEPTNLQGPRPLVKQTETAVIRDYLQAWQSIGTALGQNRADLLDRDFVGTAKDKLADTIQEQAKLGLTTHYRDVSHDIHIVFYSPEGLSVQLVDKVEYDVQLLDHDKVQTTQRVSARYIVVLTPAEVRWRVRVFQADPE